MYLELECCLVEINILENFLSCLQLLFSCPFILICLYISISFESLFTVARDFPSPLALNKVDVKLEKQSLTLGNVSLLDVGLEFGDRYSTISVFMTINTSRVFQN